MPKEIDKPVVPRGEIVAAIESRWQNAPYDEVRRLQCEWHGEALVLSGRLPTYYLKQIALNLTLQVTVGGVTLHDRIDVQASDEHGS